MTGDNHCKKLDEKHHPGKQMQMPQHMAGGEARLCAASSDAGHLRGHLPPHPPKKGVAVIPLRYMVHGSGCRLNVLVWGKLPDMRLQQHKQCVHESHAGAEVICQPHTHSHALGCVHTRKHICAHSRVTTQPVDPSRHIGRCPCKSEGTQPTKTHNLLPS